MENWREELNTILEGIDEEETHNEKGWWETSLGAEFGREVKVLIIKLIEQELDKAREEVLEEMIKENGGNIIPSPEAIPTLMFRREIREYLNNKLSKLKTKEDGK